MLVHFCCVVFARLLNPSFVFRFHLIHTVILLSQLVQELIVLNLVSDLIVPLSVVGAYGYSRSCPRLVRIDSVQSLLVWVLRALRKLEHRTWIILAALCIQDCLIVDIFHFRDIL